MLSSTTDSLIALIPTAPFVGLRIKHVGIQLLAPFQTIVTVFRPAA